MRRGGACFARLCILKAVGWGSETYVNLSDPFRILILKSSPRRDETLKLSQVQCLEASLKRFTHLLLLENITRMSNASSSTLLTCANTILSACQLLYTTRIYRGEGKILHDIIWYCMPILCPFLAAATHLAKGNLEQLASGGPSNQEPLTLFFLAQAPMNGELVFSGTISLPFKDRCTCGWKTKHTWWWVMIKDGWSKIDQWSMIEDRSMIHEKRRSMFC